MMPRSIRAPWLACIAALVAAVPARGASPAALVAAVERDRIGTTIAALEGERATPAQRAATASWIEAELASYGYTVTRQSYPVDAANVFATLVGTARPDEFVVIGAHYDTVPGSPGADDDASGVAGMLEIARVLASSPQPATIEFVAFDQEEDEYQGSGEYVWRFVIGPRTLRGMVSLEMIGYRCDEPFCQFPFGNLGTCFQVSTVGVDVGTFIADVVNTESIALRDAFVGAAAAFVPSLRVEWASVRDDGWCFPATRRSDHAWFWNEHLPAMMITDTAEYRNHNYHTDADTLDTLDLDFATDVTRATAAWALAMAAPEPGSGAAVIAAVASLGLVARGRRGSALSPAPASARRAARA